MANGNVKKITNTIAIHNGTAATLTLTDQPTAETILGGNARSVLRMDLSAFTEVRLTAKVGVVGAAASVVRAKFGPTTEFSTTAANYTNIGYGPSSVECSMAALGTVDSGWKKINPAAQTEVNVAFFTQGGDATLDPALDNLLIHFRTPDLFI